MTTLEQGRNGIMTPFGAVLGETGVQEAVAYVQQLSGQRADPEMAAAGEKQKPWSRAVRPASPPPMTSTLPSSDH